jgi:PEP-CTERM motif-containing protein
MFGPNRALKVRGVTVAIILASALGAPLANAASITTLFASNNGQDGNMFDLVVATKPLLVTSFDLNLDAGQYTLELYKKSGTWVGSETNPAAWTFVGTAGVTSGAANSPTPANFPDFVIPANSTTALYVTTVSGGMEYTNGTQVGNVAASNADLQILEGSGIGYPFGVDGVYTPRTWNGTIYYQQIPEPSSFAMLALGTLAITGVIYARRRHTAA